MTILDMKDYVVGEPSFICKTNTGEIFQTQRDPNDSRVFYFVKNGNSEQFIIDTSIRRGWDTSPNEHQYYGQFASDGQLGAIWCPRWWDGSSFLRNAEIRFFNKDTGKMTASYWEQSWLELVERREEIILPSGVVIRDTIELVWYTQSRAAALESYIYAKGKGLVGWLRNGEFKSWVTNLHHPTAPVRKTWPGIEVAKIPPLPEVTVRVDPTDPRLKPAFVRRPFSQSAPTILREYPTHRSSEIGRLISPIKHEVKALPRASMTESEQAKSTTAPHVWHCLIWNGITAWARQDVIELEFAEEPKPTPAPTPDPEPPTTPPAPEPVPVPASIDETIKMLENLIVAIDKIAQVIQTLHISISDSIEEAKSIKEGATP